MPENSFKIFDASAGSGKTYTLTKAYLKIILSSNQGYRHILAITFTNKAVNEMKGRILESLFEFSTTSKIEKANSLFISLQKELGLSVSELQTKAKFTLKKILHNYAYFDVSTIDKFTHRLIRTFAKDLKLSQNFEVVLERDVLLNEAVSRLINKAGGDKELTKILIDFALEKIDDDKSWNIGFDLNKIGELIFQENNVHHLEKFKKKKISDFLALQKSILKKIEDSKEKAIAIAQQALSQISASGLDTTDFPRETLPKHFKKVIDGVFDASKLYNNTLETKLIEGNIVKAAVILNDSELPTKLLHLFLDLKNAVYDIALSKNIYKNIVPLSLLNLIQQEVKTIQNERDQLSISEFNSIISSEIKNQPAPFIYERLGEKYHHYFIDEFQDTSQLQWNNMIPLIENALSSEAGSLFLVGDAKQAIYRWRGGRAEQFLNLVNQVTNPFVIQAQIQALPCNYRSHKEIIQFNNEFFSVSSKFLNNATYETLFLEGNQQKFNTLSDGFVEINFLSENDEQDINESYCQEVTQKINTLNSKGFAYADICILVRGNKEGVLLAKHLAQENIPIISSESLLLKSSRKIQFLINLLRFQNQPDDFNVAFNILTYLSEELSLKNQFIQKHLKSLKIFLKEAYDFDILKIAASSVYDSLEMAIKKFDLATCSDAYLNFFMDTVLDVEQKEGNSLPIFLSYWEKKKDKLSISVTAKINAVQIMTIHKAKGLEFEIVIYPFANTKIYGDKDAKLWLPVESDSYHGFDELLINKKQEVVHYNDVAEKLYEEEINRLELDAFNVLYVALTRAVKGLFIITKEEAASKKPEIPKSYSDLFVHFLKEKGLWEATKNRYEFGHLNFEEKKSKSEIQENIKYQYSYKERESFKILTKSGVLWDTENQAAISKGNLIHHIMRLIETPKDVQNALSSAVRNGDLSENEFDSVKTTILNIVNHPKLSDYFKSDLVIKNEKDIITKSGNILRPDRIVIQDNQATIIDYKTGKRDIRYKDQIDSYANAVKEMGFEIANKIIIYINEEINPEFI